MTPGSDVMRLRGGKAQEGTPAIDKHQCLKGWCLGPGLT